MVPASAQAGTMALVELQHDNASCLVENTYEQARER